MLMIKSELVQRLADKNLHLHRADLEKVVNAILNQIESALAQRHRVELRGFWGVVGDSKARSRRP
jgi:integration host factor subunit beta